MHTIPLALISVLACACWTSTATAAPTTPVAAISPTTDPEPAAKEPVRAIETAPAPIEVATAEPVRAKEHTPPATEVATVEPAPEGSAPTTPVAPVPQATADATPVDPYKHYLGAGAIYLPVDDGYFTSNIVGGWRFASGRQEGRIGAKLSYGYSPYSAVAAALASVGLLHWWGSFGMGTSVDIGVLSCSRKMGQGWDGTEFGGVLNAAFRHRFKRSEIGLDLGIIYAPGEKYSTAPTAFFTALFQL